MVAMSCKGTCQNDNHSTMLKGQSSRLVLKICAVELTVSLELSSLSILCTQVDMALYLIFYAYFLFLCCHFGTFPAPLQVGIEPRPPAGGF